MWTHNEDELVNIRNYINLEDQGRIRMNQTGILNFFYVEKQTEKLNDWVNDREWDKYIQINVAQVQENWDLNKKDHVNETIYDIKLCTLQDFLDVNDEPTARKLYESWEGFTIMCPKLD